MRSRSRTPARFAVLALLSLPAGASASTATFVGDTITITGTPGVDIISISTDFQTPGNVRIKDQNGLTAAGCTAVMGALNEFSCPATARRVVANLDAGDDTYNNDFAGIADTVSGGTGNDRIAGGFAEASTQRGTDIINGDDGNDELGAGSGAGTTCSGGAGDDILFCLHVPTGVLSNGGPGRDTIRGGDGPDQLNGDGGNDRSIIGGDGDDVLRGGEGDDGAVGVGLGDGLIGGEGADEIFGGAGIDRLLEDRNDDRLQFWSLDDVANDGADTDDDRVADEGDNVHSDVENVSTGFDDDTITGSAANNTLDAGTLGNDTVLGLGGDDDLFTGASGQIDLADGGEGNDKVQGSGTLLGGPGSDQLRGQAGADLLDGGPGSDSYNAGDGNDIVRAVDGEVDTVGCGIGADVADVDSGDVVNGDPGELCETTTVTAGAAPTAGPAAAPTAAIVTPAAPQQGPNGAQIKLILGATGTIRGTAAAFGVTAPRAGRISVTVRTIVASSSATRKARPVVLGTASRTVSKAGKVTVTVKLKGSAYRKLRRKRSFSVALTTRFTPTGGKAGAAQVRKVKLRRK